MSCSDIFLGVIAILFPPVAVWIKTGLCSADSCINILLCMLGFIPGLLHAWYIIAKYPEHDYDRIEGDEEGQQRVTYYYISHEPAGRQGRRNQQRQGVQYGTVPAVPGNKPLPQGPSRQQPPQQSGVVRTDNAASSSRPVPPPAGAPGSGSGSEEQGAPPPYTEVVRGDHKIQRQD